MDRTIHMTEFRKLVAKEACFSQEDTGELLDVMVDCLTGLMADGDSLQIRGFGTFGSKHRPPRPGMNPRTGERIIVPAGRTVKFKPAQALKDAVNGA